MDIASPAWFRGGQAPYTFLRGSTSRAPVTAPNYDVSPDGQRFLMLKPVEQAQSAPTQINVSTELV